MANEFKQFFVNSEGTIAYFISDDGQVIKFNYSSDETEIKVVPSHLNEKNGYKQLTINNKTKYIHRLVAENFVKINKIILTIGEQLLVVNHIDGNKTNNNSSNLEWVTSKENYEHALETGLITRETIEEWKNWQTEKRKSIIRQNAIPVSAFQAGILIGTWPTLIEAAEATGVDKGNIFRVINGERKIAGGLYWKRATTYDEEGSN